MTSLIRPGRGLITATWSDRKIASEMPWVTISVVAGFSVQIRSSSRLSRCRVMSSSAPNGSSSSSTDGLTTSDAGDRHALAHAAGELAPAWPSRSPRARRAGSARRPARRRASRPRPRTAAGCWTRTERHGSSAESWNAIPSSWSRRSSRGVLPSTSAVPLRRRPRARRGSAGSSTCRSPRGRAATGSCPCRCAGWRPRARRPPCGPTENVLVRSSMCRPVPAAHPRRAGPRRSAESVTVTGRHGQPVELGLLRRAARSSSDRSKRSSAVMSMPAAVERRHVLPRSARR